jgi:hypothetical protein
MDPDEAVAQAVRKLHVAESAIAGWIADIADGPTRTQFIDLHNSDLVTLLEDRQRAKKALHRALLRRSKVPA